jgi:hypothetical protein
VEATTVTHYAALLTPVVVLLAVFVTADPVPVTVTITVPMECPACPACPAAPMPAKCLVVENIKWFEHCATGPKRRLEDPTGRDTWGYWGPLSEECTMLGGQIYFEVCKLMDQDWDGAVDLRDIAIWMNRR